METIEFEKQAEKFNVLSVIHALQKAALDRIVFLALYCLGVDFIVVSGPTGVGKSHLLVRLVAAIWKARAEAVKAEPSRIPVISTFAVADGAQKFDFKRLYRDALLALNDIFVDRRLATRTSSSHWGKMDAHSPTTAQMRWALEMEFKARKTEIWIIDEAQHVLLGGKSGSVEDQFDVLKSIAQNTGVKIVLCGTHRLRELLRLTGQVMRRSSTIVFDRYHNSDREEMTQFCSIAHALMTELPLKSFPDVIENQAYFWSGTLGCVGVLKVWIAKAWAYAVFADRDELLMEDFVNTRIDDEALEQMAAEIAWSDDGSGKAEWQTMPAPGVKRKLTCAKGEQRSSGHSGSRSAHTKRSSKPGRRSPKRDPVGSMVPRGQQNESESEAGDDAGEGVAEEEKHG